MGDVNWRCGHIVEHLVMGISTGEVDIVEHLVMGDVNWRCGHIVDHLVMGISTGEVDILWII